MNVSFSVWSGLREEVGYVVTSGNHQFAYRSVLKDFTDDTVPISGIREISVWSIVMLHGQLRLLSKLNPTFS